ncbi:TPA: hypothetical protein MD437_004558 [Escherichia coli]|nr:hypothetical protein [Escherichia coli]
MRSLDDVMGQSAQSGKKNVVNMHGYRDPRDHAHVECGQRLAKESLRRRRPPDA